MRAVRWADAGRHAVSKSMPAASARRRVAPSAAQRAARAARSWNQPSSWIARTLAAGLLTLAAAGCGASAAPQPPAAPAPPGFAWLRAAPAPAGWRHATLPSGAVLAFPASWRRVGGDRGTASAALLDAHGRYLGYLNLTPRQGRETLAGWPAFRVAHNREEGETDVVAQATAHGLRFRGGGRGSCVRDAYTTVTHARYEEIACLVTSRRAGAVIVAAAPPAQWARLQPVLRQAVAAVRA
jgi:hypothetical protein